MTEYTVSYKLGAARQDGVEIDVSIARDDGEAILGSVGTRRVFAMSAEALTAIKDIAALDALVRKEAEAWDVPTADEAARKELAASQAAADKAKKLDATVATGRTLALVAVAVKPLVKDVK